MLIALFIAGLGFTLLLMLSIVMRHFRRHAEETKPMNFDFTLGELNALRNAGQLTEVEFERARAAVERRAVDRERFGDNDRPVNETRRGFDVIVGRPGEETDEGRGGSAQAGETSIRRPESDEDS